MSNLTFRNSKRIFSEFGKGKNMADSTIDVKPNQLDTKEETSSCDTPGITNLSNTKTKTEPDNSPGMDVEPSTSAEDKKDMTEDAVGEAVTDPYHYTKGEEFTSEVFKIEIRNLPRYFGFSVSLLKLKSIVFSPALSLKNTCGATNSSVQGIQVCCRCAFCM